MGRGEGEAYNAHMIMRRRETDDKLARADQPLWAARSVWAVPAIGRRDRVACARAV